MSMARLQSALISWTELNKSTEHFLACSVWYFARLELLCAHFNCHLRRYDSLLVFNCEIQMTFLEWIVQDADDVWERLLARWHDGRLAVRRLWYSSSFKWLPLHIQALNRNTLRRCIHQVKYLAVYFQFLVVVYAEVAGQLGKLLVIQMVAVGHVILIRILLHHIAVVAVLPFGRLQLADAPADVS